MTFTTTITTENLWACEQGAESSGDHRFAGQCRAAAKGNRIALREVRKWILEQRTEHTPEDKLARYFAEACIGNGEPPPTLAVALGLADHHATDAAERKALRYCARAWWELDGQHYVCPEGHTPKRCGDVWVVQDDSAQVFWPRENAHTARAAVYAMNLGRGKWHQ